MINNVVFDEQKGLQMFFKNLLVDTNTHYYNFHYTSDDFDSQYTCLVLQKSKENNQIIKRLFFSAEIINIEDEIYILKKQTFNSLKNLLIDNNDKIYKVLFTEFGTIVFDLSKLYNERKIKFVSPNNYYDFENIEYEDEIGYLNIKDGKSFTYIFNPSDYNPLDYVVVNDTNLKIESELELDNNNKENKGIIKNNEDEKTNDEKTDDVNNTEKDFDLNQYENGNIVVKRDINDNIFFYDLDDMNKYPESVLLEYITQERIKNWLLPDENKEDMLEKHGGLIGLGKFLIIRQRESTILKIKKRIVLNNPHLKSKYSVD